MGAMFIPAAMFRPVGGAVSMQSYQDFATNDVWGGNILVFGDTALKEEAHSFVGIPQEFPTTPTTVSFLPEWTCVPTTGNFQIDIDYRIVGGDGTESMDQTGTQEAITISDAAPSVAHRKMRPSLAATASNFNSSSEKILECKIARDGVTETSSIAASALLFGVWLVWT